MKHKVSRLACGLLAAVLILGTTACAGKPESGASEKFKGDHAANLTAAQENSRSRFPRPARTARETKTGCRAGSNAIQ